MHPNNAINPDAQKLRCAPLLRAKGVSFGLNFPRTC